MNAENSALHHRNKSHFKIYLNREELVLIVIIFHNITVITVSVDQINALLVSIRYFFSNTLNNFTNPKLLNSGVLELRYTTQYATNLHSDLLIFYIPKQFKHYP